MLTAKLGFYLFQGNWPPNLTLLGFPDQLGTQANVDKECQRREIYPLTNLTAALPYRQSKIRLRAGEFAPELLPVLREFPVLARVYGLKP